MFAELVSVSAATCSNEIRVVPGDPDASYLVQKIDSDSPQCGAPMPLGGPSLPANAVACVRDWVSGVEATCETCGGAACIDTMNDAANCGACGLACPSGIGCSEGSCMCPGGGEVCGDACVDTQADPNNCGACGETCTGGLVCLAGECVDGCGDLQECAGACVNTQNNDKFCGSCDNACASGQSCVAGACSCGAEPVSFAMDVAPLLDATCSARGCHSAGPGIKPPQAGLDLTASQSYANLVGVASSGCSGRIRVTAGDVAGSYLINKLRGVDMCTGETRMPKGDPPLPEAQISMIEAWICQGAPEN